LKVIAKQSHARRVEYSEFLINCHVSVFQVYCAIMSVWLNHLTIWPATPTRAWIQLQPELLTMLMITQSPCAGRVFHLLFKKIFMHLLTFTYINSS